MAVICNQCHIRRKTTRPVNDAFIRTEQGSPCNPDLLSPWRGQRSRQKVVSVLLLLFLNLPFSAYSQITPEQLRPFPQLFNAANNRPIKTEPSQSTCGYPERNAYCKSSTIEESLKICDHNLCIQTCPVSRDALPSAVDLLDAGLETGSGTPGCIEIDTINVRPGSSGEKSTFFARGGTTCYLTPNATPTFGRNGAFTLTVWIWQEDNNDGVLLEKVGANSDLILRLQVSEVQVSVLYRTTEGVSGVVFNETIPSRIWTHLAVQVYDSTLSFFINGVHSGFSPVSVELLTNQIVDDTGTYRIGQSSQGTLQFLGRLQDFRFYADTLSNREIQQVYSGQLPGVRIQSLCRCPPSHPRVRPTQTHYCIPNGEPDNTRNQRLRLNRDAHPLEYANDGDSNSIWISRFQENVTLQIDLGDTFQVFYVVLQFYSPLPRGVVMEKRVGDSAPWQRWQAYADDCTTRYGLPNNGPLPSPSAVNCLQFGIPSLPLPASKGNITFNVLSPEPVPRPGHNDFYNTPALYDFVSASSVRIALTGHHNVTETRHQYHGLFELIISARCQCNGHAESCDRETMPYRCHCSVLSHTTGNRCESCQPMYNNKPFRQGDPLNANPCKQCQCYNHADSCVYDASVDPFPNDHDQGGGGVCVSCRNHTTGRNCETCEVYYYRPEGRSLYDEDACQPCGCDSRGVEGNTLDCQKVGGTCTCKGRVEGRTCGTCKAGYYNLEANNPMGCDLCRCNTAGTVGGDGSCHPTSGQCRCKAHVRNRQCGLCEFGYFGLDAENPDGCSPCDCDPRGSTSTFCEAGQGQCSCKANVVGRQCDQCADGYYDFAAGCVVCQCDLQGTEPGTTCNKTTGRCICKANTMGDRCDQCSDGAYSFGSSQALGCISCNCHPAGTKDSASICNKATGLCDCKDNVSGRSCNQCLGNTWGLNATNPLGCEVCDCDASGTQRGGQVPPNELTCNQNSGQCTCLANRRGRKCDDCVRGFSVDSSPGGGCVVCQCDPRGSLPGTVCDSLSGQCECRGAGSGVTGKSCNTCLPTFYRFDQGTGRCTACNCHPAGSMNDTCNRVTGQCDCKAFTQGLQCDQCVQGASILNPDNPYGCSKDPAQQPPPEHVPIRPSVIQLSWLPPDYPNGVIKQYNLYRNGDLTDTIESNDSRVVYNDTGLTPFTEYSYVVEAVNDFGSVRSPPATFVTPAGIPSGVLTLQVTNKLARSADFSWNEPAEPNGLIQRYVLRSNVINSPSDTRVHWEGIATSQRLSDLLPFTEYRFIVQVCTTAGCLSSEPAYFSTLSALPEGQAPPSVTPVSATELFVQWDPPDSPNGIISFYELWMREQGSQDSEATRIFHPSGQFNPRPTVEPEENALAPPQTNFSVKGLDPFTKYEFQVLSQNDAGKASSVWVVAQTLEAAPLSTPAPVVTAVSSYRVNVTWAFPSDDQARGFITSYRLFQRTPSNPVTSPFAPPFSWQMLQKFDRDVNSFSVGGLQPYTEYHFAIEACNSISCVRSAQGMGQTMAAAPEGVAKPLVEGLNSTAIGVSWSPPASPNGPAPLYRVERTSTALNYPSRVVRGTRFPGQGFYKFPPETIPQNVGFTGIEFWFKTRDKVGLLFFAASDGQQEEFVLIQFVAGRPRFVFDPQGCVKVVELQGLEDTVTFDDDAWHKIVATRKVSEGKLVLDDNYQGCPAIAQPTNDEGLPYNNGKWHHLVARRNGKSGTIVIDDIFSGEATSRCDQGNVIGTNTGVFLGGLDPNFQLRRDFGAEDRRAALVDRGFRGCIRDMRILQQVSPREVWADLDWAAAELNEKAFPNWEGCPVNLEPGVHFMGRGYAILPEENFKAGDSFQLSLTFRSELRNGLLFFAYGGRGIYVLIELRDRSVYFEVSNGQTKQSVSFPNSARVNFCDGQWRGLTFAKVGSEVNITVRDQGSQVAGDEAVAMELTTVSKVFIGGISSDSEAALFIRDNSIPVSQGFGGCLADVSINGKLIVSFADVVEDLLNVNMDGCPQYHTPSITCQANLDQEVYQGEDNSTVNEGLQPYTEYLYRVIAENSAGPGSSPWTNGKTREAAPAVVNSPSSATSPSGHLIQVFWSNPTDSPGLLTRLALRAYNQADTTERVVETNITDVNAATGTVTGVTPFTRYDVRLVACTSGGCTESQSGATVVTREDAPEEVPAPEAMSFPSHLVVQWAPPGSPNGVITGYILYMNSVEVYNGGETSFNITGLQVYTGYIFRVEACTKQGCGSSSTAVLTTAQLPPTQIDPPVLQALGTSEVEARWEAPDQLNGVLERYQLFVSTDSQSTGNLVYNNSDLFLTYTIPDLNAGTTYFIRVAACTGGGCRVSGPSQVTTEESAPEGVPDPRVTSPSPTQLLVTWGPPSLPNGVIIRYELQHNGLKVFDTPDRQEYTVDNLLPYSAHSFRVRACTVKGCGLSGVVEARTQEAPPRGFVNIADLQVVDARTVTLQWLPPDTPNGELFYDVYFSGLFYVDPVNWDYSVVNDRRSLYRNTTANVPVTVDQLIPFSSYSVQVNASNSKGFLLSNIRQAAMPQGTPDGVRPPELTFPSPTSISASWAAVGRDNADTPPLYLLQMRTATPAANIVDVFGPTAANTYTVDSLEPFTEYEFRVVAENRLGRTSSPWKPVYTKQAAPSSLDPPRIASVQSNHIDLEWNAPLQPNGVLIEFIIYQNQVLREKVAANRTSLRAGGLDPNTQYVFQLSACTVAGCTLSGESSQVTTLQAAPQGIGAPTLTSPSPTSVRIQWEEPAKPNGVIRQYGIERRLTADNFTSLQIHTSSALMPRVYTDTSAELSPFTSYEYRILAGNDVGTGTSDWAEIVTASSRPGGMRAPQVRVLGPRSIEVKWEEPIQSNGQLEYYTLHVPPFRREFRNISQQSAVLEGLTPYTNYTATITACTSGGCTESAGVTVLTEQATPDGQLPPSPHPISQTMISVTWEPPPSPNGPGITYELARRKLRQPLDPSASGFGLWNSLYTGERLYFEDRGLTLFTTYQYRVTVFNSFSQLTSGPSVEVSTFGGVPQRPVDVSVRTLDHSSLRVNWTTPSVVELQGEPESYTVEYISTSHNGTADVGGDANSTVVTDLLPNTEYSVTVTVTINGGASIASQPVTATTMDGAPEGLPPPQLISVSDTALQVIWSAPARPNGQVTAYFIYLDGERISNQTTPGSYIINNLQPYTVYEIQMEVCTVHDCVKSNATRGVTAEAIPQGVTSPNLVIDGPTAISVSWSPPQNPNGIILSYGLRRSTLVPCSEISKPVISQSPSKCSYVSCRREESLCGNVCYSGPKVCCEGVIYDAKPSHECCGQSYVPSRTQADDICCAGKFHRRRDNYQCCGNRYVLVLPGEVCCEDKSQDRVSVGHGDTCCDTVPYPSSGPQLCCAGNLESAYGRQCCGGKMVDEELTCCGNVTSGLPYSPGSGYICCGSDYVREDSHLCCEGTAGDAKVHTYGNASQKATSNQKCCGLEVISAGLNCCNYVGYNPAVQVCADTTGVDGDCGRGTVCSVSQTNSARCDRCDFDTVNNVCHSVDGSNISPEVVTSEQENSGGECEVDTKVIYRGLEFTFTDTGLSAYSRYSYTLTVTNTAGSALSDPSTGQTAQSVPQGLSPPQSKVYPDRLYIIHLSWRPPAKPNGEIIRYTLKRDDLELYRGLGLKFTDDNTILPYRSYSYILTACTVVGCTSSEPISVATAQAPPEGIAQPTVTVVSATTVNIEWSPPASPNGFISGYSVVQAGAGVIYNTASQLKYTLRGLSPFRQYTFSIQVCTSAGCTDSPNTTVTTREAKPQGLKPPRSLVISSTVVQIFWSPPQIPNGEISSYNLYRRVRGETSLGFTGNSNTFNTIQNGLIAGLQYTFVLEAINGGGASNSSATVIDMPLVTPLNIPAPKSVTVLGPTSISVTWIDLQNQTLAQTQQNIDQYRVLLNGGSATEIDKGVGLALSTVVGGLQPYTDYSVRIRVCLSGVANGCGTGPDLVARTSEAPPTELNPPIVTPLASNMVEVSWDAPARPNGLIVLYRIHQRTFGSTAEILINQVDNETFSFRHAGPDLQPFSEYEYKVTAVNGAGEIVSSWTKVRTQEAPPVGMQEPVVTSAGAYGVTLNWRPPRLTNGIILTYDIEYVELAADPTIHNLITHVIVPGDHDGATVSGLVPFKPHNARVSAVNSAGRAVSNWVLVQTDEASPSGLGKFTVEKLTNGKAVILRWSVPQEPNGIIVNYKIYYNGNDVPVYQGLNKEFEFRRLEPYSEYTVQLEACTKAGCTKAPPLKFTTAETAPSAQQVPSLGEANATSVVVRWNKPLSPNGKIQSYEVLRRVNTRIQKRAVSEPIVVYKTTDTDTESYEFADTGLRPNTQYEYKIRAVNSMGSTESPWVTVQTNEAPPTGVLPPGVEYVSGDVHSLFISWSSPEQPNGIIQNYLLQRDDTVPPWSFTATDTKEFTDSNLEAYTSYSYRITACSGGGCTTSLPTSVRTKQSAPLLTKPPLLQILSSTEILATWEEPEITNGEIILYQLKQDGEVKYSGLSMEYKSEGLLPYQEYEFQLRACTDGGCTDSAPILGRPDPAPPTEMDQPVLRVLSAAAIEVTWKPPRKPNGVITSYDLRRNGSLIYTESLSVAGILRTSYSDYNLEAGVIYSYAVTASNVKGSVTSPSAATLTYSSSPSGMKPPELVPLTAFSIQASWTAPTNPNGDLQNYTLFEGNDVKYSGPIDRFIYIVPALQPWTEYTFRVQVCTNRGCELGPPATVRTLEASPQNQGPPSLLASADFTGTHNGVRVTWEPPANPNGKITYYVVNRQPIIKDETFGNQYGEISMAFNGSRLEHFDNDPVVRPNFFYRYMVTAFNRVGSAQSLWQEVFTKEAPPQGVPPPQILNTTARTITVRMTPPTFSNGIIVEYNVRINGTVWSRGPGTALVQTAGAGNPFSPFSTYLVQAEACTRPGCTLSSSVIAVTTEAPPSGMEPVVVVNIGPTSAELSWKPPTFLNGELERYAVYRRSGCPKTPQPFSQPCVLGEPVQVYSGLALSATVEDLVPYTAYDFQAQAENSQGPADFAAWVSASTKPAAPVYVRLPKLSKNGTQAVIDWSAAFKLNGRLVRYTLSANGSRVLEGITDIFSVERTLRDAKITFKIVAETEIGTATSPDIIFDPNAVDNIAPPVTPVTDKQTEEPVYEEVWFIVLMCVIALLLIFIILAFCIKRMTRPRPYIRERLPLEHRQKKADQIYDFGPYSGSVGAEDFTRPVSESHAAHAEIGVINPAFTNPRLHPYTLGSDDLDLTIDNISKTSKYDDDDISWGKPQDSGLYDDDLDSLDAPSYSITKEQMIFTDTHL